MRLNPQWCGVEYEKILKAKREHTTYELVSGLAPAVKYVITTLVNANIPFKVIKYGAGVTKVTTDTTVCSKCGGTGRC